MRSPAVDNYLFDLPENTRLTIEILRDIIFDVIPEAHESIKWRIPFYEFQGLLCYLNYEKKSKQVCIGFVEGVLLKDEKGVLSKDTQNVRKLYVPDIEKLNLKMLKSFLRQAIEINKKKQKNFVTIKKKL
ncbi:MAG: DUF1801 domain-containing protein [Cyclobacteriaceae bacterium]|jgi:hypothetical protein|nr:DUF1801 domain-containing protein [Cyclobacteriaceae bacterium]